jgi:alginate O-acetyltransferase complex protein AlgI
LLFNSPEFLLVFFPFVLIGFYILTKCKNLFIVQSWLIICSLFFHAYWKASYTSIFICSMVTNYFFGLILFHIKKKNRLYIEKMFIACGVIFNLSLLTYFKYMTFLNYILYKITGNLIEVGEIVLPLAISFYTFQQIAFLVDIYRGRQKKYTIVQYISYIAFFPHLIAGPIVRHDTLIKQFSRKTILKINIENLFSGLTIIMIGLFKKIVLSDSAATYVNPIYATASIGTHVGFIEAWIAIILFSFVIYFDFSGYSDMAIGLAQTFNIRFPENFASPYKAQSIIEFWQRWHITLSSFLRDYLYIPLGGNRKNKTKQYRNLMITMLFGGLWHGAGMNFIIWGGLHGIYLIITHIMRHLSCKLNISNVLYNQCIKIFIKKAVTYLMVIIAWVFFRADTLYQAKVILLGAFGYNELYSHILLPAGIFNNSLCSGISLCVLLLLFVNFLPNTQQFMRLFRPVITHKPLRVYKQFTKGLVLEFNSIYILFFIILSCIVFTQLKTNSVKPFIYFQF